MNFIESKLNSVIREILWFIYFYCLIYSPVKCSDFVCIIEISVCAFETRERFLAFCRCRRYRYRFRCYCRFAFVLRSCPVKKKSQQMKINMQPGEDQSLYNKWVSTRSVSSILSDLFERWFAHTHRSLFTFRVSIWMFVIECIIAPPLFYSLAGNS